MSLVALTRERVTAEIEKALQLASVAAARYERYSEETRRRFNKAIFDSIYLSEKRLDRWDYSEAVDPVMQTAASLGRGSDKDSLVELAGLEPAISWVRFRRSS